MGVQRILHGQTVFVPSDDPDVVLDCFRRIKQGPSLKSLRKLRYSLQGQLAQLGRESDTQIERLRATENEEFYGPFNLLQTQINEVKQQLVANGLEIEAHRESQDSPSLELASIRQLPQVLCIRAETRDTIVITVLATIDNRGDTFHLGTWDIYFGIFRHLVFEGKPLLLGDGDRTHYRVRRVVETRLGKDKVGTSYYNHDDGSFCFGNNYNKVNNLAVSHEYLHAVQLMIAYMSHVSSHKLDDICLYFKELDRKETVQ